MSGRTVGTLAGAVIGGALAYFTGGVSIPLGMAIGSTVGGVAGSFYDTTTADDTVTEQPTLADLKMQTSTYGLVIPQVWGRYRLAGNVFWATDKQVHEHRESESTAGKGGGPQQVTVTKTYSIAMAVGLCDTRLSGPLVGLARAWKDTTLVYDRAQNETLPENWTFYPGTAEQLPDPTMEAHEGVGNVPGYRYLAYVMMAGEDLGVSGRTYNYTFEVMHGTLGATMLSGLAVAPGSGDVWVVAADREEVWRLDGTTRDRLATVSLASGGALNREVNLWPLRLDAAGMPWVANRNNNTVYRIDPATNTVLLAVPLGAAVASNIVFSAGATWIMSCEADTSTSTLHRLAPDGTMVLIPLPLAYTARLAVGADGHIWVANPTDGTVRRVNPATNSVVASIPGCGECYDILTGADGHMWVTDATGDVVRRIDPASNTIIAAVAVGTYPDGLGLASDGCIWVARRYAAVRIDPATTTGVPYDAEAPARVGPYNDMFAAAAAGDMWLLSWNTHTAVRLYAAGGTLTVQTAMQPYDIAPGHTPDTVTLSCFYGGQVQTIAATGAVSAALSSGNDLPVVLTTLCGAAGISGSQLDVSEVPSAPVNMALVSMQAIRAPIEQLVQAFRLYAVESGQVLKFRKRGAGGIACTIAEGDLDAGEDQAGEKGLVLTRSDTISLPTVLDVTYTDPDQNYQQNVQRAHLALPVDSPEGPRSVSIALAITADTAKQLAQELLYESWVQQQSAQTTLPRRYAYLEPGDRVQVTARDILHTLVLKESTYGRPGLLELTAQADAAYLVGALGAAPGIVLPGQQTIYLPGATTVLLLNLPALTSTDTAPRYHVAYIGEREPWEGGALYRSLDAEATYQVQDSATLEAMTGTVSGTVPAADYHLLDTTSVITVVLEYGTLTSVSDTLLFRGANPCMIGAECLCYGVATLVGPRTYQLSRLLRGRRGTEWAVSSHSAAETFVRLDDAIHSVPMALADRNVTRHYKAVTVGQDLSTATATTFAPTAENLNPWSVAQPEAALSGTDWVLTWRYRARYGGDWIDGVGINFDNDHAGFVVTLYSDATYATAVRSEATYGGAGSAEDLCAWTYDSAMQTTDFGAPQATIYYTIAALTTYGVSRAETMTAP